MMGSEGYASYPIRGYLYMKQMQSILEAIATFSSKNSAFSSGDIVFFWREVETFKNKFIKLRVRRYPTLPQVDHFLLSTSTGS